MQRKPQCKPQAASRKSQVASRKPQAASRKPQARNAAEAADAAPPLPRAAHAPVRPTCGGPERLVRSRPGARADHGVGGRPPRHRGPWRDRLVGIASEWSASFPGYVAGAVEAACPGVAALAAIERQR
ncbi:hypothetical protein Bpla01_00250 [Burkholderia plantarii]|nr:hypothetical protein Bpla01_00250 [Burkholderia plantarii]